MSETSRRFGGVDLRAVLRWLLGAALIGAGIGHLTTQRTEFQAQVPSWFPIDEDLVVLASGVVEIALGLALIALPRHRVIVGTIVAAFFVVIFPGNIAQWVEGVDAFGLDTERSDSPGCSSSPSWWCGRWVRRCVACVPCRHLAGHAALRASEAGRAGVTRPVVVRPAAPPR